MKLREADSVNIYRNLGDNKGETPLQRGRFQRAGGYYHEIEAQTQDVRRNCCPKPDAKKAN